MVDDPRSGRIPDLVGFDAVPDVGYPLVGIVDAGYRVIEHLAPQGQRHLIGVRGIAGGIELVAFGTAGGAQRNKVSLIAIPLERGRRWGCLLYTSTPLLEDRTIRQPQRMGEQ